jgi:ferric-chelate reductase
MALKANIYGLVCAIGANIIMLFSTSAWRKKSYHVFITAHILGIIMVPIGLAFHKPASLYWVFAAVGAYGFDHLIRLCKTRICKATLRTIPELGMTRIDIPHLNAGWRAGQHVRIRVMTSGMGVFNRVESHPFTIAGIGSDGMTLMCKKAGDWTNNLYAVAARGDSAYSGGEGGKSKSAHIIIEGPYGGPGHTMFDSFSGAMFVAGGSGITYALCAVQDLIQKDVAGRSRVKVIELVWSVQDAGTLFFSLFNLCISM